MKKLVALPFFWWFLHAGGMAQPYLYFANFGQNNQLVFNYINLATCEVCEHFSVPSQGIPESVAILPNGNVLTITSDGLIVVYNPSNGNIVNSYNVGALVSTAVLAPNGNLYYFKIITGSTYETCLYEFAPSTGNSVLIGCEDNYILTNAFFWNGTLYAFGFEGQPPSQIFGMFSVVPGSPLDITLVNPLSGILCGGSTAAIPGVGIFSTTVDPNCDGGDLYFYDLPGNTINLECALGNFCYCYGATAVPPGFPPPPANCGCETEAGEISSANTAPCANETLELTSTGSDLEPGDALAYILFTDLADTLGSIVSTSATPSFSFSDPPLQTGVTYYVAAIAGNELPGGGVDLTDICLDISNVLEVVWVPLPSIGFAVANPNVCQGGCTTVEVTLTGTPPFSLTYNSTGNPGQTASFSGLTGTLQICVPGNAAAGTFNLQAVNLTDANCVCD
jgi:hypothetical protein